MQLCSKIITSLLVKKSPKFIKQSQRERSLVGIVHGIELVGLINQAPVFIKSQLSVRCRIEQDPYAYKTNIFTHTGEGTLNLDVSVNKPDA